MKLWLLRPVKDLSESDNPWEPWFDKGFGFVVRAETEEDARVLANNDSGDENDEAECLEPSTVWLNSKYSTCVELMANGEPGSIIQDYHAA